MTLPHLSLDKEERHELQGMVLMSAQGKDFLDRDDVRQALDELFEECVAEYEKSGEVPSQDVRAFLQGRGVEPPPDGALRLSRQIRKSQDEEAAHPEIIVDPETGERCYQRCVWGKDGELVCHMVCF